MMSSSWYKIFASVVLCCFSKHCSSNALYGKYKTQVLC